MLASVLASVLVWALALVPTQALSSALALVLVSMLV